MSSCSPRKILLLFAMWDEAKSVIEIMGLKRVNSFFLDFEVFGGHSKKMNHWFEYTLLVPGKDSTFGVDRVCTQFAALGAAAGIGNYHPDLVINVGTAGGFSIGSNVIGKTFLCTNFVYHDRRIPLPQFAQYGVGGFETKVFFDVPFEHATVTTGNSLDVTKQELFIMKELAKLGPLLKDMEGAAIAEVCNASTPKIPFLALKAVTDIVDGLTPTGTDFLRNLQLASENLQCGLLNFLSFLDGVAISDIYCGRNQALIEQIIELRLSNKN